MSSFYPDFICKDEKRIIALYESVKNNSDFRCNLQKECFEKGNEGKCSNCILSFRAGEERLYFLNGRIKTIRTKRFFKRIFGIKEK